MEQQSEQKDRLAEAREIVERQEAANAETKRLMEEQRRLREEDILSGRASSNTEQEQPKEETPVEYKNRIMRGEY